MNTITVYSFEDSDGSKDSFSTQDRDEAKDYGRRTGARVIANEFVWDDSETAWDFRPDVYKIELYMLDEMLTTVNTWEDRDEAEQFAEHAWVKATVDNARLTLGELSGDNPDVLQTITGVKLVSYSQDGQRHNVETEWGVK